MQKSNKALKGLICSLKGIQPDEVLDINVVQLQYIGNATQEDKDNNLVYWADLFNATTWEEFLAIAGENSEMEEVCGLVYEMNTDKQTKEILEGQRRYREQMASQYVAGRMDAEEEYRDILEQKDAALADKDAIIEALRAENEALRNK